MSWIGVESVLGRGRAAQFWLVCQNKLWAAMLGSAALKQTRLPRPVGRGGSAERKLSSLLLNQDVELEGVVRRLANQRMQIASVVE